MFGTQAPLTPTPRFMLSSASLRNFPNQKIHWILFLIFMCQILCWGSLLLETLTTVSFGKINLGNVLCPKKLYKSNRRNERHIVFPKMLSQNCKDYSQENTMYNKDPDKAGTARMFLSKMIENENTNVYSLEVSMYGYRPDKKSDKIITYTEENCECLCS